MDASAGTVVAGRYELAGFVGRGGMGEVWRARDRLLRREVALKQVTPPTGGSIAERISARDVAIREAQAAAQINHPHAVRIYDLIDAEPPWIVMEYVPSRSLQDLIVRDGPATPAHVARIGVAVLDALTAAHEVGVLHRDVKPGNVLIGHDGRVVLTDFGTAAWDRAGTPEHVPIGTPQYVPPERVGAGLSLPEGDFWSLGATLYTAVEGRPPYASASVTQTLLALVSSPPDPPRHAGKLGPILRCLLHRDPRQRPNPPAARRDLARVAGRTT